MKKVLVLCNDFPPLNSIGAQRPYSWYKYLPEHNIHVTVITKNWADKSGLPQHIQTHSEKVTEQDDLRLVIRVPEAPSPVSIYVNRFGTNRLPALRKFLVFLEQLFKWKWAWWDKTRTIYTEAEQVLTRHKFDVVITTGEPFILFKYGSLLRRRFDFKWIADYRDGWYHNHVSSKSSNPLKKLIRQWEKVQEKHLLHWADVITGPDELLSETLGKFHNKPHRTIFNGFWNFFEPAADVPEEGGHALMLTHAGTLTPGQQAEFFLDVLQELHNEGHITPDKLKVSFLGIDYFPEQRKRLEKYVTLKPYITTTPRLSQEESRMFCYKSDFLISLTEPGYKAIFAKTYDYLSVSRPILVIPDDHSILSKVVSECHAGFIIRTKSELKQFITDALNAKQRGSGKKQFEIDRSKASFYLRSEQAARLAAVIKEI